MCAFIVTRENEEQLLAMQLGLVDGPLPEEIAYAPDYMMELGAEYLKDALLSYEEGREVYWIKHSLEIAKQAIEDALEGLDGKTYKLVED